MIEWLVENRVWALVGAAFIAMHVFGHGGHGGHEYRGNQSKRDDRRKSPVA